MISLLSRIALVVALLASRGRSCETNRESFRFALSRYEEEDDDVVEAEEAMNPWEFEEDRVALPNRRVSPIEKKLLSIPSRGEAEKTLKELTRREHMAGTVEDERLARWVRDKFLEYGLDDVELEPVKVLLSFPRTKPSVQLFREGGEENDEEGHDDDDDAVGSLRRLEKKKTLLFEAMLEEKIEPSDATSFTSVYRNKTFNGYSPTGTAYGELVYANFGLPEDFEKLEREFNVSVRGRVVIVRYGKCFRGLKVMNAQKRGAVAVLIYSDPADDGFAVGEVYPQGPWRSATSVQRGSIQFNSLCAGDVGRRYLGRGGVEQLCGYHQEELYPAIPTVPISYSDALPLLRALGGPPLADMGWVGALEVVYRAGPSGKSRKVRVSTDNSLQDGLITNVVGVLRGAYFGTEKDRVIVVGAHRDAWNFGAADPGSGQTVMLETARALGTLRKKLSSSSNKWRPRRTVVFASWSGEELGLLGSTAFVERRFNTSFVKNAVAYLNTDVAVSGTLFELSASASLGPLIRDALAAVSDPASTATNLEKSWSHDVFTLGSGSDYTAFLDYAGIASADLRFSQSRGAGKNSGITYGTYHSIYDSFDWMRRFGDPQFAYHEAAARVLAIATLRLAHAPIVPIDGARSTYTSMRQMVNRVRQVLAASEKEAPSEAVKSAMVRLVGAVKKFGEVADRVERAVRRARRLPFFARSLAIDSPLNDALGFAQRDFLHPQGLPRRPWFKNVLQAPAFYSGYSAEVLPGVIQALEDQDWGLAVEQIDVVRERVMIATRRLEEALKRDVELRVVMSGLEDGFERGVERK